MCLIPNGSEINISVYRHDDEERRYENDGEFILMACEEGELGDGWEGGISFKMSFPESKDDQKDD